MKQCPFCKVDMVRPRSGTRFGRGGLPAISLTCSQFKTDDHKCPECKYYDDWECSQCGIYLFYRSEDLK